MKLTLSVFISFVLLVLLGGCAPPPEKPVRVLWPTPPDEPKIEFIHTYSSEQDLRRDSFGRLSKSILGSEPEFPFLTPFGVAVDKENRVYVSDLNLHNIMVYNFETRKVHSLSKEAKIHSPMGLAFDSQDRLYVAGGSEKKVYVMDVDGQLTHVINPPDVFLNPVFLAINERLQRLYVADSKKHQIHVFGLADYKYLFSFGEPGSKDGQLSYPLGLAIDAEDDLFVADRMNARIQVFDKDGKFKYYFGERGDQDAAFEAPRDLSFDSDGNLWVVDKRRAAIYAYTKEGRLLLVTGGEGRTFSPLGFGTPSAIWITGGDRVYVADMLDRRFSVWQYLSPAYLQKNPITDDDLRRIRETIKENLKKKKDQQ